MKRNPKTGNISTFGNDSIFSVKYWKSSTSSCKEIGIRKKVRKKHKIWQKKISSRKIKAIWLYRFNFDFDRLKHVSYLTYLFSSNSIKWLYFKRFRPLWIVYMALKKGSKDKFYFIFWK